MSGEPDKILVVDDHEENLVALEAILSAPGVVVHTAASGRDALELLLRNDYAVAVLDVSMPEMDGFALAELMRGTRRSRSVPIVFVTAGPREPGRVFRGYEAGAVDFLYKPLDAAVLRAKISVFLELHRQRRELAEALRERDALVARLRDELRLNETFAAVLAHDLRTPLSAILGSAELVARVAAGGPAEPAARRIGSSARRMARMIEALLDFSRARVAGGIPVAPRPTDLAHVLAKVTAEVEAAGGAPEIRVDAAGALDGAWDSDRLAQVLSNLVGNAVRHGAPGSPVRVAADGTAADRVRVTVHNAGAIPADVLPGMFEPFRAGRTAGGSGGLGLGLFIVRHIVEAHGGTVEVRSTEADGTTFSVELPRAMGRAEASPAAPDAPGAGRVGGAAA